MSGGGAENFGSQLVSADAGSDELSQSRSTKSAALRGGCSAAQIPQAVGSLDGQGHACEQPSDQQTVGVMMTDMLQIMAVLGVIKSLVLDFPTALAR